MTAQELSADEKRLIALVREIKTSPGFGELIVSINDGLVKMVKQTKTHKL